MTIIKSYIVTNAAASQSGGGSGTVTSVVAGDNISVDITDPANPIVSLEITQEVNLTGQAGTSGQKLTSQGNASAPVWLPDGIETIIEETGSFAIDATHFVNPTLIRVNSAGAVNITVPDSVGLLGRSVFIESINTGTITFVEAGSQNVTPSSGSLIVTASDGQNLQLKLEYVDTNKWSLQNGKPISITSSDVTNALGFVPSKDRTLVSNGTTTSHVGSAAETILGSVLIPAGTLGISDMLYFKAFFSRVTAGAALNINHKIRVNTSLSLSGATQLAVNTASTTQDWTPIERTMYFKNSLSSQQMFNASTSAATDMVSSTADFAALTNDYSVDQYIMFTTTPGNTTDTGTLLGFTVKLIKQ